MTARTFQTTASDLVNRNGQAVEVIRVFRRPDDGHDLEVLPMFAVRFPDGHETEAWRDEIRPWYARGIAHTVNAGSVPDPDPRR
jgi:hypothetical protein